MAMYRDVEYPLGILDPMARTFTSGFALPALSTLGQTSGQYGNYFVNGVSPLALLVLTAVLIYGIWSPLTRRDRQ
jgi:hypothetical protein